MRWYARAQPPDAALRQVPERSGGSSLQLSHLSIVNRGGRKVQSPESRGCLNVFGISAWHHVVGLFGVQRLADAAFQFGTKCPAKWNAAHRACPNNSPLG